MLPGRDPERGSVAAPAVKHMRIAHAGDQRRGGLWSDRLDLHEPARRLAGLCERTDLAVGRINPRIELVKLLEQSGEHLAGENRQAVLRLLQYPGQLAPQPCNALRYNDPELSKKPPDLVPLRGTVRHH